MTLRREARHRVPRRIEPGLFLVANRLARSLISEAEYNEAVLKHQTARTKTK